MEFAPHVREVMPDIDTITMATPPADLEHTILFSVPVEWVDGDYVAWLEVNVEGDYNSTFNPQTLPTPIAPTANWDSWAIGSGYPYRGQPSVVYKVPFTLGASGSATTATASFYGDVNGFGSGADDTASHRWPDHRRSRGSAGARGRSATPDRPQWSPGAGHRARARAVRAPRSPSGTHAGQRRAGDGPRNVLTSGARCGSGSHDRRPDRSSIRCVSAGIPLMWRTPRPSSGPCRPWRRRTDRGLDDSAPESLPAPW